MTDMEKTGEGFEFAGLPGPPSITIWSFLDMEDLLCGLSFTNRSASLQWEVSVQDRLSEWSKTELQGLVRTLEKWGDTKKHIPSVVERLEAFWDSVLRVRSLAKRILTLCPSAFDAEEKKLLFAASEDDFRLAARLLKRMVVNPRASDDSEEACVPGWEFFQSTYGCLGEESYVSIGPLQSKRRSGSSNPIEGPEIFNAWYCTDSTTRVWLNTNRTTPEKIGRLVLYSHDEWPGRHRWCAEGATFEGLLERFVEVAEDTKKPRPRRRRNQEAQEEDENAETPWETGEHLAEIISYGGRNGCNIHSHLLKQLMSNTSPLLADTEPESE
uniref:Uncharacterized protein n=1 Tax=Chromera velia CCMP2878 TaxID=1169474 RepID=A0A0G4I3I5_9ALVE|mmetsp:Transcript_42540/g.83868  ORF Transcript_42540/g.83868 Transcript_42540/m.83868 type:complete len:327 (-) Transcript_42540:70-1050(-)|eukprot:Cvel_10635.t1-p1 / transcript=Cvel_10635.t1 / gene=Cvel_10635 / organism=Chromera_velia_CCMP2878 / gene_product=hypothetical protein / transcript_product=hypothetical protein / location=Cvel_scaffold646:13791-16554(+) / protein_length=326 / sequence_SO=supercontig / SO=protein_coding / is_pseudo=false